MVSQFISFNSKLHSQAVMLAFIALLLSSFTGCRESEEAILWTSIHVSGESQSGDANLLRMPSGKTILIDTGFSRYANSHLIPALKERGVSEIDAILITHAHRNHYGALPQLLEHFNVHHILFTSPPEAACRKEKWAMGCNLQHITDTLDVLRTQSHVKTLSSSEIVFQDSHVSIQALFLGDQLNNPSVNDASTLFRLEYDNTSVLFTGDISKNGAEQYLLNNHSNYVRAQAITAPHHGVSATVGEAFYEAVAPDLVVVGISEKVWKSHRGKATREYLTRKAIPTFVTGIQGDLDFKIDSNGVHAL